MKYHDIPARAYMVQTTRLNLVWMVWYHQKSLEAARMLSYVVVADLPLYPGSRSLAENPVERYRTVSSITECGDLTHSAEPHVFLLIYTFMDHWPYWLEKGSSSKYQCSL